MAAVEADTAGYLERMESESRNLVYFISRKITRMMTCKCAAFPWALGYIGTTGTFTWIHLFAAVITGSSDGRGTKRKRKRTANKKKRIIIIIIIEAELAQGADRGKGDEENNLL
jgi:uncharacterized membrane protein